MPAAGCLPFPRALVDLELQRLCLPFPGMPLQGSFSFLLSFMCLYLVAVGDRGVQGPVSFTAHSLVYGGLLVGAGWALQYPLGDELSKAFPKIHIWKILQFPGMPSLLYSIE